MKGYLERVCIKTWLVCLFQIGPGNYSTPLNIIGVTQSITVRPQNITKPPILLAGANIYDCRGITVQDILFKRAVNIRNSSLINIARNNIEVVGYSPNPGKILNS